jgi:hypothetical protein
MNIHRGFSQRAKSNPEPIQVATSHVNGPSNIIKMSHLETMNQSVAYSQDMLGANTSYLGHDLARQSQGMSGNRWDPVLSPKFGNGSLVPPSAFTLLNPITND